MITLSRLVLIISLMGSAIFVSSQTQPQWVTLAKSQFDIQRPNASTAILTTFPQGLISLSMAPPSVQGGAIATGKVTLNSSAPAGGTVIQLSSNSSDATVPGSVTVSAGAKTATFTVKTTPVSVAKSVSISALSNGVTQSATLTVNPPELVIVAVTPTVIAGYGTATGTIKLSSIAPAGGCIVSLQSSSNVASVPASVTVPAGSSTAEFIVSANGSQLAVQAKITATYQSVSQHAFLTVDGSVALSIIPNPTSFYGGTSSTAWKVSLGKPVTSATIINLKSNNSALHVPATVTIPAGGFASYFSVTSSPVASNETVSVTATGPQATTTSTVTIKAPVVTALTLNPTLLIGGTSSTGTLTLSSAAPSGGMSIPLTSSSSNASVPGTVTVAAGATSTQFLVSTVGVTAVSLATIKDLSNGVNATLTLNPPTLKSFTLSPASAVGGSPATGTITISGPAPKGGFVLTLTSDNASATVPSSVTINVGDTSATFTTNTTPVGTTTPANISVKSGSTTLTEPLLINPNTGPLKVANISLSSSYVNGGTPVTASITLNGVAGTGGVKVALSSSNSSATVPMSVTIPAGGYSATFTVNTAGVAVTTKATITATLNGTASTVVNINPASLQTFSISPNSVKGGSSVTGTVFLTGVAPAGGFVITLQSSSLSAQVPATITVPAGATSAKFVITTSKVTNSITANITASQGGNSTITALTIHT